MVRNESLESSTRAGTASSSMCGLVAMESWRSERLRATRLKTLDRERRSKNEKSVDRRKGARAGRRAGRGR